MAGGKGITGRPRDQKLFDRVQVARTRPRDERLEAQTAHRGRDRERRALCRCSQRRADAQQIFRKLQMTVCLLFIPPLQQKSRLSFTIYSIDKWLKLHFHKR